MKSDVLILGSSPNAVLAGLRLRQAGRTVALLETRPALGIPYVTDSLGNELGWGFLHLCEELELEPACVRHSGRTAWGPEGWVRITATELQGQVSARDQERWPLFCRLLDQGANLLKEVWKGRAVADLGAQWRALGQRQSMEVLRLPWTTLRELLHEWFETEMLRGLLAEVACEGALTGPFASGTGYHLLRRWALGEVLEPAIGVGGSGAVMSQLLERARASGIEIWHRPGEVRYAGGRLEVEGEAFEFNQLLSDFDARWTYSRLLSPRDLETEFNSHLHKLRARGSWVRALGRGRPERLHLTDVWHFESSLRGLEKAYDPTKYGRPSHQPPLIVSLPGQIDKTRDAELIQASFSYLPLVGSELKMDLHSRLEQACGCAVEAFQVMTPKDYEQQWMCSGGHLWGGEVDLSQSFFLRPTPAYAEQDLDVWLCGASLSPGDWSGRAGQLAAQRLLI
jgi:phytoene dehydrogenase-like protein